MGFLASITNRVKKSNLARGFIITTLGSGISKVILVAATFVCSNLLGKAEFGELSFVRNTLNMVLCICALNFTTLCTKFTTEAKDSLISIHRLFLLFLFSVGVCIVIGFLLIVLPDTIMIRVFSTSTVVSFFRITGLFLPLFIMQPLIEGVFRGLKSFNTISILQITSSLFYLIAIVIGIRVNGLTGALTSVILYYLLYSLICIVVLEHKTSFLNKRSLIRGFTLQGAVVRTMILPIFLMSFIDAPIMWIAQVVLSKAGNMESIGSMTAMLQLRNLAMLIPGYFINTFVAFAGEMNSAKQYTEYYSKFSRIEGIYLAIGLIVFILFSVLSKPLLSLYGRDFVVDWPAMIVSNIGIPLSLLISLYRVDLVLKEHQRFLLYISVAWNIVWIASLFIMLKLGVNPLISFFASQNIGALVFVLSLHRIYSTDKRTLL